MYYPGFSELTRTRLKHDLGQEGVTLEIFRVIFDDDGDCLKREVHVFFKNYFSLVFSGYLYIVLLVLLKLNFPFFSN